jgi:hypothetical protein
VRAVGVGEVRVPAHVERTGDVTGAVLIVAVALVERAEVPAAVEDPQARVVEMRRDPRSGHQWTSLGRRHGS